VNYVLDLLLRALSRTLIIVVVLAISHLHGPQRLSFTHEARPSIKPERIARAAAGGNWIELHAAANAGPGSEVRLLAHGQVAAQLVTSRGEQALSLSGRTITLPADATQLQLGARTGGGWRITTVSFGHAGSGGSLAR
jgi:hypothetical protein